MFIDVSKVVLKSGDGGAGAVSFRREKYVANGGPDGGNGGKGGDIVLVPSSNLSTLEDFRFKKTFEAEAGQKGEGKRRNGKCGADLVLKVPFGTLVYDDDTGDLLADVSEDKEYRILKGGLGGTGNAAFRSSIRQTPRFAKPGDVGDSVNARLELKLLADIALCGYPNVGKSTLLSVISNAKPNIANYHFTTLTPVLGVVRSYDDEFVVADVPGLIEGASEGQGLGHDFLRHIERTRLLWHVVDVSECEGRDCTADFDTIINELVSYDEKLKEVPMFVVASKADIAEDETINKLKSYVEAKGYKFYLISSVERRGTKELIEDSFNALKTLPPIKTYIPNIVERTKNELSDFKISLEDDVLVVTGQKLEQLVARVDFNDYEQLMFFEKELEKAGIIDALRKNGAVDGSSVKIYDFEFDFVE